MDYRHTEVFARQMEAAALRAGCLRERALHAFWHAVALRLRAGWHRLVAGRSEQFLPEA